VTTWTALNAMQCSKSHCCYLLLIDAFGSHVLDVVVSSAIKYNYASSEPYSYAPRLILLLESPNVVGFVTHLCDEKTRTTR
jgi:hypothetical protein